MTGKDDSQDDMRPHAKRLNTPQRIIRALSKGERMSSRKIAVVPGDGIGPEVIAAGMHILERVNESRKLGLEFVHFGWNADEYLRTGISMPTGAMDDLRQNYAAVYLGAFGDPRVPDMKHAADILLGMRFSSTSTLTIVRSSSSMTVSVRSRARGGKRSTS